MGGELRGRGATNETLLWSETMLMEWDLDRELTRDWDKLAMLAPLRI